MVTSMHSRMLGAHESLWVKSSAYTQLCDHFFIRESKGSLTSDQPDVMHTTHSDTDLAHALDSLPAELYNNIVEPTFKCHQAKQEIDRPYRPPTLLSTNRSTRDLFASSYHANSGFELFDKSTCVAWQHLRLLKSVVGRGRDLMTMTDRTNKRSD